MEINLPLIPPVNNNIQGTVYDKLDALAFEKIRVANSQLETRLSFQERMINKYRRDAEKLHETQSKKLQREIKKIQVKKPDYVRDDADIVLAKEKAKDVGRQRSLSEASNCSYCRRYYSHHYNVRDETRVAKEKEHKKSMEAASNNWFDTKLRVFYLNMVTGNTRFDTLLDHSPDVNGLPADTQSEPGLHNTGSTTGIANTHQEEGGGEDDEDEVFGALADDTNRDQTILEDEHSRNMGVASKTSKSTRRTRKSRKNRLPTLSRKDTSNTINCVSESDFEVKMKEWRGTKRAFDKIYVGLL